MCTTIATQPEELSLRQNEIADTKPELTRTLLVTMAFSCGLGIANLYYNHP
ncbi:MAG: hypothetical protein JWN14_490, partial [Chthonomonadales bacterium]|nr:hypothetical protein [Chthonomonadales bacterium]